MKFIVKEVTKTIPEYKEISNLILRAFPKNEQFPMWLLRLWAKSKNIDFNAYFDDNTFCGISYTIQNRNMVFVLYLAVNDKIRSKGYGSAILSHLKEQYNNKPITLNVEILDENSDNYEQRVRRVEFYKRNGFQNTNRFVSDAKQQYLILSTEQDFSVKEYRKLLKKLSFGLYSPNVVSK